MAKKEITKKQHIILTLLFIFRSLTSKQIQQFLNHKDHRRINSWLKELEEKGYIIREFKPRYGVLTKPAVCSLTNVGRTYIRESYDCVDKKYLNRIRHDETRSVSLKSRCQVIADFYLVFFKGREREFLENIDNWLDNGVTLKYNLLQFFTPAFYGDIEYILIKHLKSDGYLYKRTKAGTSHRFLYVIDAYVPRLKLQYMLKYLFTVLSDENWQDDGIVSLQIYFICPSNMVIIYLRKILKAFLENYFSNTPLHVHFTTRNQMYKRKQNPEAFVKWITISYED